MANSLPLRLHLLAYIRVPSEGRPTDSIEHLSVITPMRAQFIMLYYKHEIRWKFHISIR